MAGKQLLQTRLKSINSLLDNNAKQLELTRSKIASILTPLHYQECQDFIDTIKEKRFIKVRERRVRKLNNLINKKEGVITWQSSQATRAFPRANNRQAGSRLIPNASPQVSQSSPGERALPQSPFSQAVRSQASLEDNTLSSARSVLSQAGSSQASLVDNTLSMPRSVLFQAGSSQASLVDSTLSPARSMLFQAGSSQASPLDSTLSLARSVLFQAGSSQASPVDSTQSLASSALSQAGSSQASPADSTPANSALFQAGSSQASPADSTPASSALSWAGSSQAGSSQAGNSHASPEENTLSPAESELSQGSFPSSLEDSTLQATRSIPPQAVRCLARLRARQAGNSSREVSEVSQ